ncbi:hypothetical protein NCS52_01462500 [Fusarium sp. LHS14.1]|nr:hypothetical protein NCS52_01462500 [Fusarium sp. LHS14.1]
MNKWLLVVSLAASASATCYYPDGSNAAKDYKYEPCGNSTTTYSTCCYFGEGDKCLANGLCNQPDRFDYRAACQNKDWSNCPEVCMDTDSGTWFALQECGKNKYCCPPADGSDCCKSGAIVYTLAAPSPDGDSDSSSSSNSESESGTAAAGAADATQTGSSTAETSSTSSNDKGGAPIGAIVGGVVGGIAVIAILAVGGFCFFRRRGKKPVASPEGTVVVEGGAGSSGSNSSDISKEKAAAYKQPQSGVAEVEGTAGNVYTEADSMAISKARFNVRQEADEEALIAAEGAKTETYHSAAPQKEQQRFAEIEGSRGNVYSEADSQAISKARFDAWRQAEEASQFSYQQEKPTIKPVMKSPTASPNLAEIAGSPGNVYTEADSQPVTHTHSTIVSHPSGGLSSTTSSPSIDQSSINHSAFHTAYGSPVNSHGHMTSFPHDATLHQLDQHTHASEAKPTASQPNIDLPGIQSFTETGNTETTFTESVSQAINHPPGNTTHHTSTTEQSSTETKPTLDLPDIQASGGSLWDIYASSAHVATSQPATKINHPSFAEAEGSAGTVFTEADSNPISKPHPTSFQLLGDNTLTSTSHHTGHQTSFTEAIESPSIVSTESHSHTISIPQSTTAPTTTTHTSSSSEKPPSGFGQQSFAEAEGSPGNVYTEVDSQPIGKPRPGNQAEEHVSGVSEELNGSSTHQAHQHHTSAVGETTTSFYTEAVSHSTNQEKPLAQRPSESSVVEIEGSAGNRYTEADSQPINPTRIENQHSHQQTQATSGGNSLTMQQPLDLAEIEGSAGKLFLEADSTAISPAPEDTRPAGKKSTMNITQLSLPEIEGSQGTIFVEADSQILEWTREEPKTITQQTSTVTEVEESPGNVYSEADSKAIGQSHTKEITPELDVPLRKFVEIEGSAGNVYSEADSKTISVERIEETRTTTETKRTHELS